MFQGCAPFDMEQPYQAPLVNNPSASWLQTPPSQMPWGIPVANQPSIMRFTGDPSDTPVKEVEPNFLNACKPHSKRKSWDTEIEYPSIPLKQHITEEKMAENLNGLHISNSYVSHQIGSSQPMSISLPESKTVPPAEPLTENTSLPLLETALDRKDRTVSLCEQLRKLISEASVIPSPLLNKVERPCNALVLWQPPGGSIFKNGKLSSGSEGADKQSKGQQANEELKPSTSGHSFSSRSSTHSSMGWPDLMDNNNSNNAMDLNLLSQASSMVSELQPSEVPLPDDDLDLQDESMMDF